MTQKVLPNGEEKFGPYLKFVMDEKEGSDEQYIKAFGLYLIKKHLLDKSPVFAEAKTEYVTYNFETRQLKFQIKVLNFLWVLWFRKFSRS